MIIAQGRDGFQALADGHISVAGPCLYDAGRRLMPTPLRAFVDFIKVRPGG